MKQPGGWNATKRQVHVVIIWRRQLFAYHWFRTRSHRNGQDSNPYLSYSSIEDICFNEGNGFTGDGQTWWFFIADLAGERRIGRGTLHRGALSGAHSVREPQLARKGEMWAEGGVSRVSKRAEDQY